jgi:fibronectin-binding autotransporter adhesin
VDAVSGGAGDDTIFGIMATAGTYTVGDNINGGSGTDTLNIIDVSGTAASVVSLDGVEIVNVRSLVATGTDVTELDAADWDGVTKLTNASSIAGSELQVSGLSISTNVNLVGNTDISIEFSNTTTANAAATLVGAGTFAGVTTYGVTGVTSNATAHLILDATAAGRVSAIAVELSGNNLANIEAGANVEVYTITGNGSAVLFTDDTLISVDASGYAGSLDITLNGVSDVVAKGGAGNDTVRFGTTYSNNDSFNGGAGNDTIAATFGSFFRNLNTTDVEVASLTFTDDAGATVNATASTVATYNLIAGSAGADAIVAGIANAAVVNIGSDNLDDVSIGYASGATTSTINLGSASGTVGIDAFTVSGASSVTVNANGGTGGAGAFGVATFDGVKTLAINTVGGESDVSFTDVIANAATAVTITSNGSAGITLTSALDASTALTSLVVSANGSDAADISLGALGASATADKLSTISLSGVSGADVTISTIRLGNGATAAATGTVSMVAGSGSIVGASGANITTTGAYTLTLDLSAGATGTILLGDIQMQVGTAATAASTAISLVFNPVTVGAAGRVAIDGIGMTGATAGAQVTFGSIVLGTSAGFLVSGIDAGTAATGRANVDVSDINITLGADASATFETILTTGGAVGAITVNGADSASASFAAINASSIGAITVTVVGDAETDFAGLTAVSNIGAISLSISDEADVTIGAISAGGDIDNITIGNGASATANFATVGASSIGNITISGAGFVDFGAVSASRIGTVDASQMTSGTFNIDLSAVTNAVEVKLGSATNTIISGIGNDVITLLGGRTAVAGNDTIRYSAATQGTDNIINFIGGAAASGGDVISVEVGSGGLGLHNGNAVVLASAATVSLVSQSAGTGFTMASANNLIRLTTAYASTATMVADLASGSGKATLASGTFVSGGKLLVVWSDGTDSYVSVATNMSSGGTTMASGSLTVSDATLVQIAGVTPGALVAANFVYV